MLDSLSRRHSWAVVRGLVDLYRWSLARRRLEVDRLELGARVASWHALEDLERAGRLAP